MTGRSSSEELANPVVILADTNIARRVALRNLLGGRTFLVDCNTTREALAQTTVRDPSAVVLGSLPENEGSLLDFLSRLGRYPVSKVVLLADASNEDLAIAAFRTGIRYYLKPPILPQDIAKCIEELLPHSPGEERLLGESPQIRRVREAIRRFGKTEASILITGETGTGKELVASSIHQKSARAAGPLITVNCAAIPDNLVESELFGYERGAFTGAFAAQKGKFAIASGGTIFLDEIGDMSLIAQAKVLRALETGEIQPLGTPRNASVDVRAIAATHHDLDSEMAAGRFRSDLYYRLNVVHIHIAPLRERLDDLPLLVRHIVSELNTRWGRSVDGPDDEVLDLLRCHHWPGNVRELRNLLESAFWSTVSNKIQMSDFDCLRFRRPASFVMTTAVASTSLSMRRSSNERDELVRALEATRWNKSQAAEMLKWSRMTVYRKIDQYGLNSETPTVPLPENKS